MKKLLVTATDMMMIQFLAPHVCYLNQQGYHVEIACSVVGNRMADVQKALGSVAKAIHTVRLDRSPLSSRSLPGYLDLKKLLQENQYDIIWTNEPVMGVMTRLAARKQRKCGTKVVYFCHGFHFYKGAGPLKWLIFYPIERFMSHFCDCIVTINREDYACAKTFHASQVNYIHGIGMNIHHLKQTGTDIRHELCLPEKAFLVLSVGELNRNKNHRVIIDSLSILNDPSVHYVLCGKGPLAGNLKAQAAKLGLIHQIHFLGYRSDIADIYSQADVFVLPSYREGLSVASLEAMYFGLPLITSRVRGSADYLKDDVSGFLLDADDAKGFAEAIRRLQCSPSLRSSCGTRNRKAVLPYRLEVVQQEILKILTSL